MRMVMHTKYLMAYVSVCLTNREADMRQSEDKTDNVWLLKRRSICLPGNPSKYSSFTLSPSAHSYRDFQHNGEYMKNKLINCSAFPFENQSHYI